MGSPRTFGPGKASVLVASNRGPVSFAPAQNGELTAKRGGGGLVSGLSSVTAQDSAEQVWVCAALSDGDRAAVRRSPGGRLDRVGLIDSSSPVRMLDIEAETLDRAYNAVANSTLWFIHHMLYATPFSPAFEADPSGAIGSRTPSTTAPSPRRWPRRRRPQARVVVQDYHLALVPKLLRDLRPDLSIGHFSHTPWAPPDYFGILPDEMAHGVLEGMLGADYLGFLTRRWALGVHGLLLTPPRPDDRPRADRPSAAGPPDRAGRKPTRIGVHSLGVDADFIVERASRPDVEERLAALREAIGRPAGDRARRPHRAVEEHRARA